MKIRKLTPRNWKAVQKVIRDSFRSSVADSWSEEGKEQFLHTDCSDEKMAQNLETAALALGAFQSGVLAGVVIFPEFSRLSHLFVLEEYRRQGIARSLFEAGKAGILRDESVRCIELTSTEFAVPAYEALGFREVSRRFRINGCVFQPMVYWLQQDRLDERFEFFS